MVIWEIVAVYCESHTERVVHIVTTGFKGLKTSEMRDIFVYQVTESQNRCPSSFHVSRGFRKYVTGADLPGSWGEVKPCSP
jgi:hypothetical protein